MTDEERIAELVARVRVLIASGLLSEIPGRPGVFQFSTPEV